MNNEYVVDIEADDLLEDVTKIHCMSIGWVNEKEVFVVKSTTDYNVMRRFLTNKENICIGHNFNLYDVLVCEKILRITVLAKIRDTLALSWYLQPTRNEHNLESYAVEYGEHKTEIENWKTLPVATYIVRCEKDVHLQYKLWCNQWEHLLKIYDEKEAMRFIEYTAFKLDCIKEQLSCGLKFNETLAENTLAQLLKDQGMKIDILAMAMPKVPIMGTKKMPVKMYNSKSELSAIGVKWCEFLKEKGLPITHTKDVEFIRGYEEPNPGSHVQIKNWLFALGWKPEHFKFNRNKKTGEVKQVPQIAAKELDGTLCPSILKLIKVTPALEELNGLSVINHRIGVFKGMLKDQINGRLYQNIWGFTNTMRLTHQTLVNLPKISVPYGKEIRGCLVTDNENTLLCGSDCSGLEDNTKQHYIYNYDPEYVKEMRTPGFDPHLDIALLAGLLSAEQIAEHNLYKKTKGAEGVDHSDTRYKAKTTNFSATYGAFPKKIAQTAGITLREAENLFNIYWERNKAVKQTAEAAIVKTVGLQMWIFNPISRFWYSLRYEKDRFSTLNQSSGVYVFDTWVGYCRKAGIKVALQMHDEILFNCDKDKQNEVVEVLNDSMVKTNNLLKLNVEIGCSVDFGTDYSQCH